MLSEEEKHEIDMELAQYPNAQAISIDALKIVQRHRGWVSDDALNDLAEYLKLTPADLDGVATFYNLIFREPVGRHVILVCNSVTCWALGYERIHAALKDRLGIDFGGTTEDRRFTMLPTVCIGICDHAPALMIDEDTYTDLDENRLDPLLERYA